MAAGTPDPLSTLSYALVTPVRSEAENLSRLLESVVGQEIRPTAWVIVDNGSTDETMQVADAAAAQFDWIRVVSIPGEREPVPGAPIVRAFHAGLEELEGPVDVVVKLDADVSFQPDYFTRLMRAFGADESLGLASGVCYEKQQDGEWGPTHVTRDHVRGATRAYRWGCLQQVLPLEPRVGWDTVDELKAGLRGWQCRIVEDAVFLHHRAVGARDGGRHRARALGSAAYFTGYRFPYLLVRTLYHARRDPAQLATIWSYLSAAVRREPCADADVRAYLREQQRLRLLPLRVREALGRRD